MSLYDHMPPYHYDTEDFKELRKAYDALEADFNIASSVLDSATTPRKWEGEILDDMIAAVGYADDIAYYKTDAAKREFLFYYLTNMRLMTETAFKKHVELAFGSAVLVSFASGGTYTNGRNSTDFEPQWEYYPTVLPKYTITINNSRNVYIRVDCPGATAEHYTPDGVNTYTLAYDRLISHISETFPIGFRLKLDVNLHPVGSDNEIFIGAVSNVTDAQISETGNTANIYPQWFVYKILGELDDPSSTDRVVCDYTTSPRRYYVQGFWYDEDNITDSGYDFTRSGFHVDLTQTVTTTYVSTFSIPPEIDLSKPIYLGIGGGTIRIHFNGSAPNKWAYGRWDWLTKCDPNLTDAELVYDSIQNRTTYVGFTANHLYSILSNWIEHSYYSEEFPGNLAYTINTSTRILTLTDWAMQRTSNRLQLFGTSLIEPSNSIVYLDSNGVMTDHITIGRLDDTIIGGSESLGAIGGSVPIPDYEWTNAKSIRVYYNTRGLDIVVWEEPSTSPDNHQIGTFPQAPDESHVWSFEWDEATNPEVDDEFGRPVGFIPIAGGYVATGYANDWPSDPSYTMNTRYSECDYEVNFPVPLDYQPSSTFTLKETEE